MDKKILLQIEDEQKRLSVSKIIDSINLASKHSEAKFSHFLDPAAGYFVKKYMLTDSDIKTFFWGGYRGAEREIFCAYPKWQNISESDFPIECIFARASGFVSLTHRDYLGSLMGLGIEREQTGDIVLADGGAYIFCKKDICPYIMQNLTKVGKGGVRLTICSGIEDKIKIDVKEINISVASLRLDSVLSGALNLSRGSSSELIKSCKVKVNFDECENLSKILSEGDLISVRGFGRLKIGKIGGESRKGRTFVKIEKYL